MLTLSLLAASPRASEGALLVFRYCYPTTRWLPARVIHKGETKGR